MASQFKNRLVGVIILVALVVIFLPTVIDGKKNSYQEEFVATPIKPEVEQHTQQLDENEVVSKQLVTETLQVQPADKQTTPELIDDIADDWEIQEVAETVEVDSLDPEPELKATKNVETKVVETKVKVAQQAWTIQLGAFQNAANINSLLKTLHKAGFQAHTIPTEVIDGKLTRLFVGPDVSKAKLEKQLPRLKRLTKLEGKLLPFDAVNP